MPIDLDAIQSKEGMEFTPIPDGLYYMRVTAGMEKDASADKNAQHEFELTIQHGEFENRKFKHWFALSEKMVPYLKHFYSVLGAKSFGKLTPSDYQGKPFMAEVYIDEYNGKKNNKLQLGMYYEWDGKAETANGVKPEKKDATAAKAAAKAAPVAAATKPAPKKSGPFSNAAATDEPPF